jgi:hypothetical protein
MSRRRKMKSARIRRQQIIASDNFKNGDCLEEKQMLQSLSSLTLEQMLDRLNGYLSNHKPCINIKPKRPPQRTFNGGGSSSRNHCAGVCGDISGDGNINVLDVVAQVNMVLNSEYHPCGDVNGDGNINVLDVVLLVGGILGGDDDWTGSCPIDETPLGDYTNSMLHKGSAGTSYCKPCDNGGGSISTSADEAEDPRFCCAYQDPNGDGYHDAGGAIENMGDYVALPGDDCVFVFSYIDYDCYINTPPHEQDGCTDDGFQDWSPNPETAACNYNPEANIEDGSCEYPYDVGCWDGINYCDPSECSECDLETNSECNPCDLENDPLCLDSGCGVLMDKCFQCGGNVWTCYECCGQYPESTCEDNSCINGSCQWNGNTTHCDGPESTLESTIF